MLDCFQETGRKMMMKRQGTNVWRSLPSRIFLSLKSLSLLLFLFLFLSLSLLLFLFLSLKSLSLLLFLFLFLSLSFSFSFLSLSHSLSYFWERLKCYGNYDYQIRGFGEKGKKDFRSFGLQQLQQCKNHSKSYLVNKSRWPTHTNSFILSLPSSFPFLHSFPSFFLSLPSSHIVFFWIHFFASMFWLHF